MDKKALQAIKERLGYTGNSATDHEDAVALSREVDRLMDLIERSGLEETDNYVTNADGSALIKGDRILVSKDRINQEKRIAEALSIAAKHARENTALREQVKGKEHDFDLDDDC